MSSRVELKDEARDDLRYNLSCKRRAEMNFMKVPITCRVQNRGSKVVASSAGRGS